MVQAKKSTFGLLLLMFFIGSTLSAQRGYNMEYGFGSGASNYLGEIGGGAKAGRPFIMDMKFAKTRWNEQLYVRYKFDPLFAVKFAFNYMRISGDDKLTSNPGRRYRNLSFRNDIYDVEGTVQWLFYSSNKPMGVYSRSNVFFTAYLFAGIAGFHHNPKTLYKGDWVALQPLQTEGVRYSKWGYCLPFGVGAYVTINKRRKSHRIGIEINWRYTNTDYLDDVSTVYVNPAELSSSLAAELSNRNTEIDRQPDGFQNNYGWHGTDKDGNPINMAPRGNKNDKDSYLSVNVTYGIAIKGFRKAGRGKGRRVRSVTF